MEAIRSELDDLKCVLLPEHFDAVRSTDFAYVLTQNGRANALRHYPIMPPSPAEEWCSELCSERTSDRRCRQDNKNARSDLRFGTSWLVR
jgi:hypothetical protein